MSEHTPPGWFFPVVMGVAVSVAIALMVGYHHITRILNEPPIEQLKSAASRKSARSPVRRSWVHRRSFVPPGATGSNVTLRGPDGKFAGSESSRSSSEVQESSAQNSDLHLTLDEIAMGMLAVAYRTRGEEPTKEAAILRAFPHVTSKGGGAWQRASKVYDAIKVADTLATKQELRKTDYN